MVKLNKMKIGLITLLVVIILGIGLLGLSCVSGVTPVGWSGGTVANGVLYVGSNDGKLLAIDLTNRDIAPKPSYPPLEPKPSNSLLGCSASSFGCGSGKSIVQIYGTPVVSDELVYIAGYNGKVYAFNTSDNKTNTLSERWQYPPKISNKYLDPFVGGPIISQGKLFIGCADGNLYTLDAITGQELAVNKTNDKTNDKIWGSPAIDGDTLYIGSFDKKLYAFDITTINDKKLASKWDKPFETQGAIISTPLIYNDVVYVGSFDKYLYSIDAKTGKEIHKFAGKNWFWSQPVILNDMVYAGNMDGLVYVLNSSTLEKITEYDLGSAVASAPVISGQYIIFASHDGLIKRIDSITQEIKPFNDNKDKRMNVDGPLTAYDGILYVHPQGSDLELYNIENMTKLNPISLQN